MDERVITQEDLINEPDYCFLCVFHDMRTQLYGLSIKTNRTDFNLLMGDARDMRPYAAGSLDKDQIKGIRDFLTDILEGRA